MADLQISQLPVLTSVAAADEVPIVDVSGSETRKITAKNLIQQGVALIDAGSIPGSALASLGANTVVTASITDANVTNAKLEHSSFSLGGLTISLGSTDNSPALDLTDATNYPASSLTGTITNAQLAGSIANNKLANSSISLAGVSINLGDSNATPTFDLTNATNYPASSLTGTVSNAQLAGSIANSKLVNSSINIGGVSLSLGDIDSSPAFDLSDATNYPTSALSGTITNAQLAGSIQGSKILAGSISSTELGTNSVTAVELANLSVDTAALIDSSVTDVKISAVSGTKITAGSLPATAINASNLGTGLAISSNNLVINNTVSAGSAAKVTFSSVGLITGSASLASSDLPLATTTSVGGISVGGGLSVTGAGALSLSNSISAATVSGIQFNAFGQIVSATSLTSSDLPLSTTSQVGGVQVTSGGGLSVDGSGGLSTSTSGISAGTYTKLTVNTKGVATAGQLLVAGDIPDIPATKLTTGVIDAGRIGAGTIDSSKLSNSSTAIIQSIAQLGFPTAGVFTGQLLFDPIAEDAYLWDGNAWNPITTLTKGALQRFGTYDANLSQVDSVTSAGAAAGLSIGANLPVASESVDGGYVVISVQGTPSGVAGITGQLSPPDYLLGVTNTGGSSWQEIDLSSTVASQVASQIGYTPFGQISSNNVQSAIDELETEKLAKSGGELTGELLIGATGSLVFEGSTADAFETKLVAQDPSVSDKILTLPNITGTLITTSDTDTVTSTMVDGSLTNTNLAANSAIAFTKLASLTAASILVGNASNEVAGVPVTGDISIDNAGLTAIGAGKIVNSMVSGTAAIDGSKVTAASLSASGTVQLNDSTNSTSTSEAATANALKTAYDLATTANTAAAAAFQTTGGSITGDVTLANAKELRFSEASGDGSNYTAFKAQAQSSDITYTWPNTSPSGGQVLKANASTPTTLEWATDTTNTAAGSLTGTTLASNVVTSSLTSVGSLTALTAGGLAYPTSDGSANQYLKTDGSGNLSFGDVSSDLVNDTSPQLGGDLDVNGKSIDLADSTGGGHNEINIGTGAGGVPDLKIMSNGAGAFFEVLTGTTLSIDGKVQFSDGTNADALVWDESTNNLEFKDNNKLTFGNGNDLQIWHEDTVGSHINNSHLKLYIDSYTGVVLEHNTAEKLATSATGITITGTATATAFSGPLSGDVTGNVSGSAATVTGSAQSAITSVGALTGLAIQNSSGPLLDISTDTNAASASIYLHEGATGGTANGGAILYDGVNNKLSICCGTTLTTERISIARDTGAVTFSDDVTLTGASANIVFDKSDNALEFADTAKAVFGSDSDSFLQFDGTNTIFRAGTSPLYIQTDGTTFITKNNGTETLAKFISDGAVELFHNNSKSFYTTDNGAVMQGYEGVAGIFELHADEGDDNADKWRFVAESGTAQLSIGNYSTGSWVNGLTLDGSNNATFAGSVTATSFSGDGSGLSNLPATSPAGSSSYIQYNNSGAFGANNNVYIQGGNGIYAYGSFTDQYGGLRDVPGTTIYANNWVNSGTRGRCAFANGNFYLGTASTGYVASVINITASDITISRQTSYLYNTADGSNNSSYTLASRGMATFYWQASSTVYMSGSGIS